MLPPLLAPLLAFAWPWLAPAHDPAAEITLLLAPGAAAARADANEPPPPPEGRIEIGADRWNLHVESELASASYRARRWEVGVVLDNVFGTSELKRDLADPPHPGLPFEKPPPVEGDRFAPGEANLRFFARVSF